MADEGLATDVVRTERIAVTVSVDTDELRKWAGKHADAGHHGVAHVLYKAATDGEALTEQALREARAAAWDEGRTAQVGRAHWAPENPYRKPCKPPVSPADTEATP